MSLGLSFPICVKAKYGYLQGDGVPRSLHGCHGYAAGTLTLPPQPFTLGPSLSRDQRLPVS